MSCYVDGRQYANGRIPRSALVPIRAVGGQTAYLSRDAARGWFGVQARAGYQLKLNGPNSGYRTYGVQALFYRIMPRGKAAYPGTSNHGCAKAGDCDPATIQAMRRYGAEFGWSNAEGASVGEAWHWVHTPTSASRRVTLPMLWPTLQIGDRGPEVHRLQTYLKFKGFFPHKRSSTFGPLTRRAVKRFQKARRLRADGVVGPRTWAALRQRNH